MFLEKRFYKSSNMFTYNISFVTQYIFIITNKHPWKEYRIRLKLWHNYLASLIHINIK